LLASRLPPRIASHELIQKISVHDEDFAMRFSDSGRGNNGVDDSSRDPSLSDDPSGPLSVTTVLTGSGNSMKLIPWEDIWTSLRVARIRGNGEMIAVFYDTLFKEAVFDDNGAWAFDPKIR
jgi:hypothetical protein